MGNAQPESGDGSGPERSYVKEVVRHAGAVFASTLGVQITTFAITAMCGILLPIEEFARLSVMVAAITLSMTAFDLGMNVTITKRYGETKNTDYLSAAYGVRIMLIPVAAVIGAGLWSLGQPDIGLGVFLGGLNCLWRGARASDQARQDYFGFVRASVVFMILRLVAGLTALKFTRDPAIVVTAIYAMPLLAVFAAGSFGLMKRSFSSFSRPSGWLMGYMAIVYVSQLSYNAIPYAPQFLIDARLEAVDVGRYGLILTFTAPVSLVIMSVRSTLLPKMLGSGKNFEQLLWSLKGAGLIFVLWCLLMCGALVATFLMSHFYGHKYPDMTLPYLIFFGGFVTSGLIGLLSLSAHTQNVPHYNMIINLIKVGVMAPVLFFFGHSLMSIILISIAVMVIGEMMLALLLKRRMA